VAVDVVLAVFADEFAVLAPEGGIGSAGAPLLNAAAYEPVDSSAEANEIEAMVNG